MTRLALVALCLVASVPSLQARTLLFASRLIDGTGSRAHSGVTVIVDSGHIAEIVKGRLEPSADDEVIDLSGHTVLPGFIDLHVHLSGQFSKRTYLERFQLEPADLAFRSVAYAERTLMAGFTTVRNPGDSYNLTVSMRNAIAAGHIVGPRILTAAKAIATTGGHSDPTNGIASIFEPEAGPEEGVINGPWEAARAVRQRYKDGADFIKITATGGVLSVAKSGQNPQFTDEEMRAIVETAEDYGMHVAAHAHGVEGMQRAIRAGVRTIEHGTLMDDETIQLMLKHGTFLVPTLMPAEWALKKAETEGFFPEVVRQKALEIGPKSKDTLRRAHAAGVRIAFGTDCGVTPHGENAQEFALLIEAGMEPMEAIIAATRTAAEVLGMEDQIGILQSGMVADIVAVPGDPLEDITRLQAVDFVMKEGTVYRQSEPGDGR